MESDLCGSLRSQRADHKRASSGGGGSCSAADRRQRVGSAGGRAATSVRGPNSESVRIPARRYAGAMKARFNIAPEGSGRRVYTPATRGQVRLIAPLVGLATAAMLLVSPALAGADTSGTLTVIGTSDVSDSGLIPNLIGPQFQQAFPQFTFKYIGTASGTAVTSAETGSMGASALIVHAPTLENQFVAGGSRIRPAGLDPRRTHSVARSGPTTSCSPDRPVTPRGSPPTPPTTSPRRSSMSRPPVSPARRRSSPAAARPAPRPRNTRSGAMSTPPA